MMRWRKHRESDGGWVWRHEIAPAPTPERFDPRETELDRAWRLMVLIHTTFRSTDQGEYFVLLKTLNDIERLFLDRADLLDYYEETHQPPGQR